MPRRKQPLVDNVLEETERRILAAYGERYEPLGQTIECQVTPPKFDPVRVLEAVFDAAVCSPDSSDEVYELLGGTGLHVARGRVVVVEPPESWGTYWWGGLEAVIFPGGVVRWPQTKSRPPIYCVFHQIDCGDYHNPEGVLKPRLGLYPPDDVLADDLVQTEVRLGVAADVSMAVDRIRGCGPGTLGEGEKSDEWWKLLLSRMDARTAAYITLGRLAGQGAVGLVLERHWVVESRK